MGDARNREGHASDCATKGLDIRGILHVRHGEGLYFLKGQLIEGRLFGGGFDVFREGEYFVVQPEDGHVCAAEGHGQLTCGLDRGMQFRLQACAMAHRKACLHPPYPSGQRWQRLWRTSFWRTV